MYVPGICYEKSHIQYTRTLSGAPQYSWCCVCAAAAICIQCSLAVPCQAVCSHPPGQRAARSSATPRDVKPCITFTIFFFDDEWFAKINDLSWTAYRSNVMAIVLAHWSSVYWIRLYDTRDFPAGFSARGNNCLMRVLQQKFNKSRSNKNHHAKCLH